MSATVTYSYDDGSEITYFDVTDDVTDYISDNFLYKFESSIKV